MLTFSDSEVWKELREIAVSAFPTVKLKPFRVSIEQRESKSVHGDYHPLTGNIRIFNLSRKTAHIIKTTIHELAHHVDVCVRGKSGHDKEFYVIYKRLLEKAHEMGKIDLSDTIDEIDARDLSSMKKKVGSPIYKESVRKEGVVLKALNSFDAKDELKAKGFVFSPTEKAWVISLDSKESSEIIRKEILAKFPKIEFKFSDLDNNEIESIYFAVLGRDSSLYEKREVLKSSGWRFDQSKGWFKRIKASETKETISQAKKAFGKVPFVSGKW